MYLALMTVLASAAFLMPGIGLLRWLKKGSMFNRKILLVVSAICIVFSILTYVSYEKDVEEAVLGLPPEARPYVDGGEVVSFPVSSQFGVIFTGGILLGACWLLALRPKKKAGSESEEQKTGLS